MLTRKFVIPALAAAGFAFAVQPAAAGRIPHHVSSSGWHHGHNRAHGGWHGASYHSGHRRHGYGHHSYGVRTLRTLPILIEQASPPQSVERYPVGRAPGVPDAVPYTPAGRSPATTGVNYSYGGYDLPTGAAGGTYVGGIAAIYQPGNGTYLAVDANVLPGETAGTERPSAKIITVTPETGNAACQMEQGVCIIRP